MTGQLHPEANIAARFRRAFHIGLAAKKGIAPDTQRKHIRLPAPPLQQPGRFRSPAHIRSRGHRRLIRFYRQRAQRRLHLIKPGADITVGDRARHNIGGADKIGDKPANRLVINLLRRPDLRHAAAFHHDHPVGHGQRFGLIMRDVHRRKPVLALQRADL